MKVYRAHTKLISVCVYKACMKMNITSILGSHDQNMQLGRCFKNMKHSETENASSLNIPEKELFNLP